MEFEGFDWDAGNTAKCQKHGVSLLEIESLFSNRVLVLHDAANSEAETRFRAIGVTTAGRHVFVVFTWRGKKLRPPSARYMHGKEVKRYDEDNPDIQER